MRLVFTRPLLRGKAGPVNHPRCDTVPHVPVAGGIMQNGRKAKPAAPFGASFSNLETTAMRLALFEPDIPQNAGALMRLAACLGIGLDIIEPCGFLLDDRRLRRAGMDYLEKLDLRRHESWSRFESVVSAATLRPRLLALTTSGEARHVDIDYRDDDILLVGRESEGLPDLIRESADARVVVPMVDGVRSLNVATAAAIVLGEALRQTRWRRGEK